MGRMILAVVVAIITAGAIFLLVHMIATLLAPPPKNFSYMTPAEVAAYMQGLPMSAYITMLLGFILGSFAAGWMVTKLSKQWHSLVLPVIVGVLLVLNGMFIFFSVLPGQPIWFIAASLVLFIPLALFGHMRAR